jgi:hypothetical protein
MVIVKMRPGKRAKKKLKAMAPALRVKEGWVMHSQNMDATVPSRTRR